MSYSKWNIGALKFLRDIHLQNFITIVRSIAALNILVYKGKNIPEDVSVFGFQNTRYTLLCRPQLSTINVPIHEIGARAMKILTTEMSGEVQDAKGKVILEHSIIKRGTTK